MKPENPFEAADFMHAVSIEKVDRRFQLFTFPDGFSCYSHTGEEATEAVYNEIFVKQEYLMHGLSLDECKYIVDVGSNIGLFTVFAKLRNKECIVHSFDPIQDNCDSLARNVEFHILTDVHIHHNAIGSQDGVTRTFKYYPHMSNMASFVNRFEDGEEDLQRLSTDLFGKKRAEWLFQDGTRESAEVRTLSSVIEDEGIAEIDFLKIDVEGDEIEVFQGLLKEHLERTKQIVCETHGKDQNEWVQSYLKQAGFNLLFDSGLVSKAADVANVYAVRS